MSAPEQPARAGESAEQAFWADTNVNTQIIDRSPQPGRRARNLELGEPVGLNTRELFVSCDVAQAMRMALDQTGLRYMVIADLIGGTRAKQGFLEVARESGWAVQRLIVRRQGFGDQLAVVLFMDSPAQDGETVRVFCADVQTDEASRRAVAHVLMARAELAALLVPDMAGDALAQAMQSLANDVDQRDLIWTNRHLIFMPSKTSPELVNQLAHFRMETGIQARMAPAVFRADQIWVYLGATWNQLQEALPAGQRLTLKFLALKGSATAVEEAAELPLARRAVNYLMRQVGVQRVCLFQLKTGQVEAHSGSVEDAQTMVAQGRNLLRTVAKAGEEMVLGRAFAEASFVLAGHRVLLRGQPWLPGVVMMLVMLRDAPSIGALPSREQLLRD